jgi:WD40 repeat protein
VLNKPRSVERFLREARAAAQLHHPHIVPVYDAGRDGEHYYIASAFINGRTLAASIKGPLDPARAAVIARDLAEALAQAHSQGIVHRDVKPANVMLDEQGRAYLMDFGLAQRFEQEEKLTREGAVIGTPAYMAPEQAAGSTGEALPASDQYSLGVVLYEMLCGKTPFKGPSPVVLHNVLHRKPPLPRRVNAEVPRDLETIALKAMAKRPEDRYRDCQAFAADLRRWLEDEPIQARRMPIPERFLRWCRAQPLLATAFFVVLACLASVAVMASVVASSMARAAEMAIQREEDTLRTLAIEEGLTTQLQEQNKRNEELLKAMQIANEESGRLNKQLIAKQKELEKIIDEREKALREKEALAHSLQLEIEENKRSKQIEEQERYHKDLARVQENLSEKTGRPDAALLEQCAPNLRGWEWNHLHLLATDADAALPHRFALGREDEASELFFSPKGKYVAIVTRTLPKNGGKVFFAVFDGLGTPIARKWRAFNEVARSLTFAQPIHRAVFSPDERQLAVCVSGEMTALLYDAEIDNKPIRLGNQDGEVIDASYSPDGKLLATVTAVGTLAIWDLAAKRITVVPGKDVWRAAYSSDGRFLAVVQGAKQAPAVKLLDAKSFQEIRALAFPKTMPRSLFFSPSGKTVALSSEEGTVYILEVETGQQAFKEIPGQSGRVSGLAYSPDGQRITTLLDSNRMLKLWSTDTGLEMTTLRTKESQPIDLPPAGKGRRADMATPSTKEFQPVAVAFRPGAQSLVVIGSARQLVVWDAVRKGELKKAIEIATGEKTAQTVALAWSQEGSKILAGMDNGAIRMWDVNAKKELGVWQAGEGKNPAAQVAFSRDGKRVIAMAEKRIFQWEREGKKQLPELMFPGRVQCFALAAQADVLAVCHAERPKADQGAEPTRFIIATLDLTTGLQNKETYTSPAPIKSLQLSRDAKTLAAATVTGGSILLEVATMKVTLSAEDSRQDLLAIDPAHVRLVIHSRDKILLGTKFEQKRPGFQTTWEELPVVREGKRVPVVVFSSDGKKLATTRYGGFMLWSLKDNHFQPVSDFIGHKGTVKQLAFSPDDLRLASAGEDKVIRVWELKPDGQP